MTRFLPILLCSGCLEPTAVRVHGNVEAGDLEQAREGIAIASVLVPLEQAEDGPLHVFLTDDLRLPGETVSLDGCNRVVKAVPSAMIIAHEIGHMLLGGDHHRNKYNLMADGGPLRADVTDYQVRTAERTARRLRRCR